MPNPPDFDWPYIRQCYEAGESAYMLNKRMGSPSKQAILRRVKLENWTQPEPTAEVAGRMPIVAAALSINSTMLTDELLRTVLGMIGIGSSEKLACDAAGISQKTWIDWKNQDERLSNAVRRARAGKLSEWIGRIDKASEHDWKAAEALLKSQPETREHFGNQGAGGGKIEVIINISRGDQVEPRLIEQE